MLIDTEIKDEIREYIYAGAGAGRLPSERSIARQFALKRNLVREVLLALEGEGIVERNPRRGYRYVDYDSTDPGTAVLLRYVVEREAARKALRNRTAEDLQTLRNVFDRMTSCARTMDLAEFLAADMDFHTVLVAASHDNTLIRIFDFMKTALFRRRPGSFTPEHERTLQSHRAILNAVRDGDAETLEHLLRLHLGRNPAVREFRERERRESSLPQLPPEGPFIC